MTKEICDECYECKYFWQNDDGEYECQGHVVPCVEFLEMEDEQNG